MFNPQFQYFNKFFVVGTIQDIADATRNSDGSSYGAQLNINTGDPSGFARVKIPNNKNLPMAYDAVVSQFEIGSRVKIGFKKGEWLTLDERVLNGRTYRGFTQFFLPDLAPLDEHNRIAGKLTGELVGKDIVDDYLQVSIRWYNTDKDGKEKLSKQGESEPQIFTLVARDKLAQEIYDVEIGANVETSVRFFNQLIRNDYGDVEGSINEVRVERFLVHGQSQVQTPTIPQFVTPAQTLTPFNGQPPQTAQTPFPPQPQQTPTVPFPNVGQQQTAQGTFNPFAR